MELQIKIIGSLLILLAFLHIFFPKHFNWKQELSALSLINRQMMYVHMFFIALGVFLVGLLCLTSSDALLHTPFGRSVSLVIGIFCAVRLYFQFFVYSARLWKGKAFETTVHVLFSFFWGWLSIVFILAWFTTG